MGTLGNVFKISSVHLTNWKKSANDFKFILLLKCFCATVCKQAVYLKIKLNLNFLKMEVSLQKD